MDGVKIQRGGSWQHFVGIVSSMAVLDAFGMGLSILAADFQAGGLGRSLVYLMLAAPLGCIFVTLIVFSKAMRTRFPLLAKVSIIGRYAFFWALLGGLVLSGYILLWLARMSSL